MENLRAFMLITALREIDLQFEHYPEDVETDSSTSEAIVDNGFYVALSSSEDVEKALQVVKLQNSIHTYEVLENAASKPAKEAPAAASAQAAPSEIAASAPADTAPASAPPGPPRLRRQLPHIPARL